MKKVAAHKAYVKAVCQRLAVVNACRQAEKAAAQQLHAAQQQRAAAQQAKAESDAALVRVKEQVFVARSTQRECKGCCVPPLLLGLREWWPSMGSEGALSSHGGGLA
jgi:hypothetical protein